MSKATSIYKNIQLVYDEVESLVDSGVIGPDERWINRAQCIRKAICKAFNIHRVAKDLYDFIGLYAWEGYSLDYDTELFQHLYQLEGIYGYAQEIDISEIMG